MAPDPTVESARTALEKRRALEHEAALAHLEKLRVEAIQDGDALIETRRALTTATLREEFKDQRTRRKDWCERAVASASYRPLPAEDHLKTQLAERDLMLTYDPKGLAETIGSSTTYAPYFEEHARSARACAIAAGASTSAGLSDTMSVRDESVRAEETKERDRAIAELDDFDERVTYFHTTSLRDRCKDRGWILSPAGKRSGGIPASPATLRVSNPPVSFNSPDF